MADTSCRNCIAATYDGKTQIGCKWDRLSILEKEGVKIIPAYDDTKEFYVIDGTCYYYRNYEWSKKQSVNEHQELIEKENTLDYHAVLWENPSIDIKEAIQNFELQSVQPTHITVLLRYASIYNFEELKKLLEKIGSLWTISVKLDLETDNIYYGLKSAINKPGSFTWILFSDKDNRQDIFHGITQDMLNKGMSFHYVLSIHKSILIHHKTLEYYLTADRGDFMNKILEEECLISYPK